MSEAVENILDFDVGKKAVGRPKGSYKDLDWSPLESNCALFDPTEETVATFYGLTVDEFQARVIKKYGCSYNELKSKYKFEFDALIAKEFMKLILSGNSKAVLYAVDMQKAAGKGAGANNEVASALKGIVRKADEARKEYVFDNLGDGVEVHADAIIEAPEEG